MLDYQARQALKDFEDQILDILLVLDSTSDAIASVTEMYKQSCHDSPAQSQDVSDEFDLISFSLDEKNRDVLQYRKKVETIHVKVQGTTNLVRACTFLIPNFQVSDEKNSSYPAF